jgi:hypothetical protein
LLFRVAGEKDVTHIFKEAESHEKRIRAMLIDFASELPPSKYHKYVFPTHHDEAWIFWFIHYQVQFTSVSLHSGIH